MRQISIVFWLLLLMLATQVLPSQAQNQVPPALDNSSVENNVHFVCPMHSHIVKDHSGTCPICGMDLVARALSQSDMIDVNVSGAMQQAMALTTESVQRSSLWRFINTYGSIQFDETGLSHLHPRAAGWIEKLTVNSLGQRVKKGQLLYEIYSPDLLIAQEDFLSLLSSSNQSPTLLERGRRRLSLLGLSAQLVDELEKTRKVFYQVPYFAQQDGIVSALEAREGMYIETNSRIMTLADLSQVWVIADVFEHQIDWVEVGKDIEIDLPALDLFNLEGKVEFIYPTLDPITRTLQVRMVLTNEQELLKPDMLASVRIYAGPVEALNIPIDALIQTEKHNRVFVKTPNGKFQRRDVEVGIMTNGRAEIRHGLKLGELVVTAGQFLLDAEASLSNVAVDSDPASHQH